MIRRCTHGRTGPFSPLHGVLFLGTALSAEDEALNSKEDDACKEARDFMPYFPEKQCPGLATSDWLRYDKGLFILLSEIRGGLGNNSTHFLCRG